MARNGLATVVELARDLEAGRTTARALAEAALAKIEDPGGEGARAFVKVDSGEVLAQADFADMMRGRGRVPSLLLGLPVSIKDLFDIAGEPTPAGSTVLADAPAAAHDAAIVVRLRAAGAILMGRTNMTEFAYSGLGINPHHGTPGNPPDRERVPGGSSAGAAVSVGDAMAVVAIGTDTGGSVRIPAAYCGLAGFKPSQARVPLEGCLPLSSSLDSIGPLGPSLGCCTIVDAVLAGEAVRLAPPRAVAGLRIAVVQNYVLEELDETVARAFDQALSRLSGAGARVVDITSPELDLLPELYAGGGLAAAEAYAWHQELLARRGNGYDPRVSSRILVGAQISAADYIGLLARRREIIERVARQTREFDAVAMPTVANVAPRFDEAETEADFGRLNRLSLRNTSVCNFLDRCAATLPCQAPGELPVGFSLMGENGADHHLLAVARAVEALLSR